MILRCTKLSIWLFIFVCTTGKAQFGTLTTEASLLRHLRQHRLYEERYFVLNNLASLNTATLKLEKAWTLSALSRSDSALAYYNTMPFDSIVHYGFRDHYLVLLFTSNHLDLLGDRLRTVEHPDSVTKLLEKSLSLLSLMKKPEWEISTAIENSYVRCDRLAKKSVFVAGALSAIIPGTGKVYYGQKRQGWNFLIANAVLGIQAYESYRKAGIKSARFIVFGTTFSLFYIANIYGSVKGLVKARYDQKRQLHYEIKNSYFNSPLEYPGKY